MEDFYISMSILSQGKKAISEFGAICHEDVSNDITEEFKRKTRISTGNFQNLSVFWTRLFRFDAVAFCFYSHKVIRWKGPFIILLMFSAAFILSFGHDGTFLHQSADRQIASSFRDQHCPAAVHSILPSDECSTALWLLQIPGWSAV
jgi:cellulose synthase/poly-beta-1,6-N-acetylglucosamine synthase-like glycosyltransferase